MIKGKSKPAHTAQTKYGMGDYYGTAIKNPIGRMRDNYEDYPSTNKKLGKAPKSLA